jgi:hypothetical protein
MDLKGDQKSGEANIHGLNSDGSPSLTGDQQLSVTRNGDSEVFSITGSNGQLAALNLHNHLNGPYSGPGTTPGSSVSLPNGATPVANIHGVGEVARLSDGTLSLFTGDKHQYPLTEGNTLKLPNGTTVDLAQGKAADGTSFSELSAMNSDGTSSDISIIPSSDADSGTNTTDDAMVSGLDLAAIDGSSYDFTLGADDLPPTADGANDTLTLANDLTAIPGAGPPLGSSFLPGDDGVVRVSDTSGNGAFPAAGNDLSFTPVATDSAAPSLVSGLPPGSLALDTASAFLSTSGPLDNTSASLSGLGSLDNTSASLSGPGSLDITSASLSGPGMDLLSRDVQANAPLSIADVPGVGVVSQFNDGSIALVTPNQTSYELPLGVERSLPDGTRIELDQRGGAGSDYELRTMSPDGSTDVSLIPASYMDHVAANQDFSTTTFGGDNLNLLSATPSDQATTQGETLRLSDAFVSEFGSGSNMVASALTTTESLGGADLIGSAALPSAPVESAPYLVQGGGSSLEFARESAPNLGQGYTTMTGDTLPTFSTVSDLNAPVTVDAPTSNNTFMEASSLVGPSEAFLARVAEAANYQTLMSSDAPATTQGTYMTNEVSPGDLARMSQESGYSVQGTLPGDQPTDVFSTFEAPSYMHMGDTTTHVQGDNIYASPAYGALVSELTPQLLPNREEVAHPTMQTQYEGTAVQNAGEAPDITYMSSLSFAPDQPQVQPDGQADLFKNTNLTDQVYGGLFSSDPFGQRPTEQSPTLRVASNEFAQSRGVGEMTGRLNNIVQSMGSTRNQVEPPVMAIVDNKPAVIQGGLQNQLGPNQRNGRLPGRDETEAQFLARLMQMSEQADS